MCPQRAETLTRVTREFLITNISGCNLSTKNIEARMNTVYGPAQDHVARHLYVTDPLKRSAELHVARWAELETDWLTEELHTQSWLVPSRVHVRARVPASSFGQWHPIAAPPSSLSALLTLARLLRQHRACYSPRQPSSHGATRHLLHHFFVRCFFFRIERWRRIRRRRRVVQRRRRRWRLLIRAWRWL